MERQMNANVTCNHNADLDYDYVEGVTGGDWVAQNSELQVDREEIELENFPLYVSLGGSFHV